MPNISAEERDKTGPVWDMSQERAFIETIVGQRFNFFMVFFSLVVAGGINARDDYLLQCLVFTVGAIALAMLSSVLARAQYKLDLILSLLFQDPTHPATIINERARGGSRRKLIGYVLPRVCLFSLTVLTVLAWLGYLSKVAH
jgi:hypothetical protein